MMQEIHHAMAELNKVEKFFKMKEGLIGDPNIYLGAKIKMMEMPNG